MPTLILTPRYTDDAQALWKAAASLGWQVERLVSWRVPAALQTLPEPVLYGEALFGPTLAAELGLDLLGPPEDWLVRLPFAYRKRAISLSTLGLARQLTAPAFVKPPNDKSFPAAVYKGADLPTEYDDDMPVLVSDVVTWEKEFRCFILDRSLRTFSVYARAGELQRDADFHSTPEEDAQVREFIGRLLADPAVDLPAATVVDVGTIAGLGWACVEQNAAWGAGIYGCDPAQVLEVLQRASIKLDNKDRR
ncbi:ATP-grasp domain-containing protein [Massilia violaceinigra]|uniref:ATP-grasp domain-containing protein n=1 Tax=Massilia violaceinigra TaxID=2045208 RepID=A0ABY4A9H2_9BURK|nr:ATP-grasp domain-containing protein [Massilia violaceinigra]UOD29243.1 ATP-grasp domain-containing protein [Massilia violaceinigra]